MLIKSIYVFYENIKLVVADELAFTARHTFFNDLSKEEIKN